MAALNQCKNPSVKRGGGREQRMRSHRSDTAPPRTVQGVTGVGARSERGAASASSTAMAETPPVSPSSGNPISPRGSTSSLVCGTAHPVIRAPHTTATQSDSTRVAEVSTLLATPHSVTGTGKDVAVGKASCLGSGKSGGGGSKSCNSSIIGVSNVSHNNDTDNSSSSRHNSRRRMHYSERCRIARQIAAHWMSALMQASPREYSEDDSCVDDSDKDNGRELVGEDGHMLAQNRSGHDDSTKCVSKHSPFVMDGLHSNSDTMNNNRNDNKNNNNNNNNNSSSTSHTSRAAAAATDANPTLFSFLDAVKSGTTRRGSFSVLPTRCSASQVTSLNLSGGSAAESRPGNEENSAGHPSCVTASTTLLPQRPAALRGGDCTSSNRNNTDALTANMTAAHTKSVHSRQSNGVAAAPAATTTATASLPSDRADHRSHASHMSNGCDEGDHGGSSYEHVTLLPRRAQAMAPLLRELREVALACASLSTLRQVSKRRAEGGSGGDGGALVKHNAHISPGQAHYQHSHNFHDGNSTKGGICCGCCNDTDARQVDADERTDHANGTCEPSPAATTRSTPQTNCNLETMYTEQWSGVRSHLHAICRLVHNRADVDAALDAAFGPCWRAEADGAPCATDHHAAQHSNDGNSCLDRVVTSCCYSHTDKQNSANIHCNDDDNRTSSKTTDSHETDDDGSNTDAVFRNDMHRSDGVAGQADNSSPAAVAPWCIDHTTSHDAYHFPPSRRGYDVDEPVLKAHTENVFCATQAPTQTSPTSLWGRTSSSCVRIPAHSSIARSVSQATYRDTNTNTNAHYNLCDTSVTAADTITTSYSNDSNASADDMINGIGYAAVVQESGTVNHTNGNKTGRMLNYNAVPFYCNGSVAVGPAAGSGAMDVQHSNLRLDTSPPSALHPVGVVCDNATHATVTQCAQEIIGAQQQQQQQSVSSLSAIVALTNSPLRTMQTATATDSLSSMLHSDDAISSLRSKAEESRENLPDDRAAEHARLQACSSLQHAATKVGALGSGVGETTTIEAESTCSAMAAATAALRALASSAADTGWPAHPNANSPISAGTGNHYRVGKDSCVVVHDDTAERGTEDSRACNHVSSQAANLSLNHKDQICEVVAAVPIERQPAAAASMSVEVGAVSANETSVVLRSGHTPALRHNASPYTLSRIDALHNSTLTTATAALLAANSSSTSASSSSPVLSATVSPLGGRQGMPKPITQPPPQQQQQQQGSILSTSSTTTSTTDTNASHSASSRAATATTATNSASPVTRSSPSLTFHLESREDMLRRRHAAPTAFYAGVTTGVGNISGSYRGSATATAGCTLPPSASANTYSHVYTSSTISGCSSSSSTGVNNILTSSNKNSSTMNKNYYRSSLLSSSHGSTNTSTGVMDGATMMTSNAANPSTISTSAMAAGSSMASNTHSSNNVSSRATMSGGGSSCVTPTLPSRVLTPPTHAHNQSTPHSQQVSPMLTFTSNLVSPMACPYEYILVVDFEATCEEQARSGYLYEIIEFPVVVVDVRLQRVVAEFHRFVRPRHKRQLSEFCRNLTGIRQDDVDSALSLEEVIRQFERWYAQTIPSNTRTVFATDGPTDFREFLFLHSVMRQGIRFPVTFYQFIDVKQTFASYFHCQQGKIKAMLDVLNLPLLGRLHSGLDDARNIARIVIGLLQYGCTFCELPLNFLPTDGMYGGEHGSAAQQQSIHANGYTTGTVDNPSIKSRHSNRVRASEADSANITAEECDTKAGTKAE